MPGTISRPDRSRVEEMLDEIRDLLADDGELPGDDDNLIEWGLDSIALMSAASRWRRTGVQVAFGELAAMPTLGRWRELLAARGEVGHEPSPSAELPTASPQDDVLPLAPLQHAYWVGRQDGQQLGGVAAHLYTEFDGADVDPDRVRAAVTAVLQRHPMLRLRVLGDGTARIQPVPDEPPVSVVDLRSAGPDAVAAHLDELRRVRSHQRLDIEAGQVIDVGLTLLPAGRTRLHLDVDMVAADARSYRVLLADLAAAYAGTELPPASPYTYGRYLAEHGRAVAAVEARDRDWWSARLDGLPGPPELPLDRSAHTGPPRTGRRARWLDPETRDRLAARAREHGLTLAMALACAYAEVVGGWSGSARFLLNVPLFDREPFHPDVGTLVGDFTSSVLLDVDVSEPAPFAERAAALQAQLYERAEHTALSGVHVLRELTRARGEQVVAPVVFTSALGLGELFDPGVRRAFGAPVWILSQGPQVLLDAQVTELDGGVLVNWDVREDLLAPGVADAMSAAFGDLVDRLTDDAGTWRRAVTDLLGPEQRAARDRANDTATTRPARCLHAAFFDRASATPDAPALLWGDDGGRWSHGDLAGRALCVAGALAAAGVRPGDLVAVSLPKGPDQIAVVLGVLAAGGTYLPVARDQPDARRHRILGTAGCRWIVTDRAVGDEDVDLTVLDLASVIGWSEPLSEPVLVHPAMPAYVLYTSGSTGDPKGVEVPHEAAAGTVDDLVQRYGLGSGDRTLGVSAMEFDLSVFDVFAPLSVGGAVVMVREPERDDARAWATLVRTHGVTVVNCVPAVLDMLLMAGRTDGLGATPRLVLLGGDWVGVDLPGRVAEQLPECRFVGLGGTTETAIHSTACEVVGGQVPPYWHAVPYGRPLDDVRCRVVDDQSRDRPDWAVGELWIGGRGVARGYRGDPERTADRFVTVDGTRWYRTGDLARYRGDGILEFLGRADHQVKLRGHRIELGEVEAALAAQDGVRRAIARLDGRRGGSLQAVVAVDRAVLTGPDDVTGAALRAAVAALLPSVMVPDRVVVLDELPLTRNGKPDRRAVDAVLDRVAGANGAQVEPATALEHVLLTVWQDVLDNPEFGVTDDFVAGGGDSVLATRAVTVARETLRSDRIRVRDVFTARTVRALAATLTEATPELEDVAAVVVEISALSDEDLDLALRS